MRELRFSEVAWLLRHGELPSRAEYEQFCADINHKTMVGEDFRTFMGSFRAPLTR